MAVNLTQGDVLAMKDDNIGISSVVRKLTELHK
jgi:hypothetical protein